MLMRLYTTQTRNKKLAKREILRGNYHSLTKIKSTYLNPMITSTIRRRLLLIKYWVPARKKSRIAKMIMNKIMAPQKASINL
jgi:hypothetical protein